MLNPTDIDLQNAYYNGWLSNTYVSAVIVWLMDGTAGWAQYNMPGSWHDSSISGDGGLNDLLLDDDKTPPPFHIIADSAFPTSGRLGAKIMRSRKDNELRPDDAQENFAQVRMESALVSIRQGAEWGMRGLQACCTRLHKPLSFDPRKRQRLLKVCIMLFNFRTRTVGQNQIRTVFDTRYERKAHGINL